MLRGVGVALCYLELAACATPPNVLPANFPGPTAALIDSSQAYGAHQADFFHMAAIDGAKVQNALDATIGYNAGRGPSQLVQGKARPLETRLTTPHIVGESHYAAPIWALKGENYRVEGDIRVTPVAGHRYLVKRSLGPEHSAVWLEDLANHAQVGNKLMIRGDASLNRGSTLLLGNAGAQSGRTATVEEIPPPAQLSWPQPI